MYKKILITILSLLCLCSNPVYAEDGIEQPVAPPIETVVETKDGEDNTITVEEPKTEVDTAQGETEEVNKEDTVEDDNTSDSVQVENKDENTDLTENTTDDPALFEERIDNGTYATTAGTNTTQEKSTEVSYAIEESYEWTIHSAIDFGTDINNKTVSKGNRVNVSKNVLMKGNKLVIKVKGSGTNNAFTISNGNGETLSYTVGDGSKTFNANDVILELQAGTNEGYKDLEFKLNTNNKSKYAGAYTGTVSYTAEILTNYVGYYADTNGDGTVDGVIFADLAIGGSGTWNPSGRSWANSTGTYSYGTIPVDELKSYRVSQESYDGKFGTKPVLSPEGSGKDRFYVMALENIDSSTYTWYANAYNGGKGLMTDYRIATSPNFGAGKQNTINMINKWNNKAYGKQDADERGYKDIWGVIQEQTTNDWFVPSAKEWAAFGGELGVTKTNYSSLSLPDRCWSSSQYSDIQVWAALFCYGYVNGDGVNNGSIYVRLATTF